jgi:soluble lytic murein transglycosylase-like protein
MKSIVISKTKVVSDYIENLQLEIKIALGVTVFMTVAFAISLAWGISMFKQNVLLLEANKSCAQIVEAKNDRATTIDNTARTILAVREQHGDKKFNPYVAHQWARAYVDAAAHYKLPLKVLLGMGIIESGYRHTNEFGTTLVSHAGAEGIMQVMPQYWGHGQIGFIKSPKDLRNPVLNIWAGAHVLSYYVTMYGDIRTAILVYNRGPAAVDRDIRKGLDPERHNDYAVKVLHKVENYL